MKNRQKRTRKLEIKLHASEEEEIRAKFGRLSAEVGRSLLLRYRVNHTSLARKEALRILRALALHRTAVLHLRAKINHSDAEAKRLLLAEESQFQALLNLCLQSFLNSKKAD